jgi:ABC-2 type transport system permease protein
MMQRPARTLALRTLADSWVRTLSFGAFFALYAFIQAVGYRNEFPTLEDRRAFARSFGGNPALKLFYGTPQDLTTVGGYCGWRVAGVAVLVAAFFGLFSAVRVFRGEEESGRHELVVASVITRRTVFLARSAAILVSIAALWLAVVAGLLGGRLPMGGSAFLALSVASVASVYFGVGAVASQLVPSSRGAFNLAAGVFGVDFLVRVVADIGDYQWLHWVLPLGWAQEMRAFAGSQPAVLFLPAVTAIGLLLVALRLDAGRDAGDAIFKPRDTVSRPRLKSLASPATLALRLEATSLGVWGLAIAAYGIVMGTLSKTVASANLSANIREQLGKFGADISTAQGVLGLYFIFFVLAISFFCCTQVGAIRSEESDGRLETLFALPQGRNSWLAGRLLLAAGAATGLGLLAGTSAALGGTIGGASISYPRLWEAGLNCLPASLLFLGLGSLLVAVIPRGGVGASYALVSVAFVWELVGALLGVPGWALGLSPFHQVGLVPAAAFRAFPAAVMIGVAVIAMAAALIRFRTRDLVGV